MRVVDGAAIPAPWFVTVSETVSEPPAATVIGDNDKLVNVRSGPMLIDFDRVLLASLVSITTFARSAFAMM